MKFPSLLLPSWMFSIFLSLYIQSSMLIALPPAPWSSESWGLGSACRICNSLPFHQPSQQWLTALACGFAVPTTHSATSRMKHFSKGGRIKGFPEMSTPLCCQSKQRLRKPSWAANSESPQTCHPQGKVESKSLPASPNRSQTVLSSTTSGSGKYITSIFHPTLIVQLSFSSKSHCQFQVLSCCWPYPPAHGQDHSHPLRKCTTRDWHKFGFVKTNTDEKTNTNEICICF